jgi:hypothetical protein
VREDDFISVGDTIPEMLVWKVDQEPSSLGDASASDSSLRETVRDAQAFERTQIIDMDEVMGIDEAGFEGAEHALTDLAGAVGHELNNPLTTCVGYLRQISDMVSSDDGQMAHMVERLGRNLNRIHSIVGELEMLAAESTERRTRVDLAMVVERVHAQLSGFLDADVELDLRQAHLLADRPRLYQLVYIMLAAHMLDDENEGAFSVRVSSRTVGACLEIIAPHKPQGSLRLDLLGILRRDTLAGSTPLGLAAQLTQTMGGSWFETELADGHRVTAVLPRRFAIPRPRDTNSDDKQDASSPSKQRPKHETKHATKHATKQARQPQSPAKEPHSKTLSGSTCNSDANLTRNSSRSRR